MEHTNIKWHRAMTWIYNGHTKIPRFERRSSICYTHTHCTQMMRFPNKDIDSFSTNDLDLASLNEYLLLNTYNKSDMTIGLMAQTKGISTGKREWGYRLYYLTLKLTEITKHIGPTRTISTVPFCSTIASIARWDVLDDSNITFSQWWIRIIGHDD